MASDVAIAEPRARAQPWIVEAAFTGFLLLVFIGLTPFAPRFPEVLVLGESGTSGSGDILRQISFLGVFSVVGFAAFRKFGAEAIALVPLFLGLVLIWCLASALWAAEPGVTFRRAGLEVVVVLTAIWGVETLGIERSIKLLRGVFIAVLVLNWVSIPLTSRAIHQPGELDPSLVGAWRGLYFHKNIAGSVSAVSTMLFLFFAIEQKSRTDWFLFVAALAFTVMTKSKSSMGLMLPALAAWGVYRATWQNGLNRSILFVAAALLLLAGVTVVLVDWSTIVRIVSDPQEFTGRTAIWQAEVAFIADHPLLGSGFGSFANTGAITPLHNYVGGQWIEAIAHGHNGYLQMMVTGGLVGFALTMVALVLQPAIALWRRDAIPLPFKAFLAGLFVFMVLHNLLESDFLEGDGPVWVVFLLMLAMLQQAKAISTAEEERRAWTA